MTTSNDKIIIPTIGRRVWFRPDPRVGSSGFICHDDTVPMDAGIVYVWNDQLVNLDVCDHAGNHHAITSVPLIQSPFDAPAEGQYCEWMPFQKGQAKAAIVTATAGEAPAVYSHRSDLERGAMSEIARHVVAAPHRASEVGKAVKTAIDALLANDGPPASPPDEGRVHETQAYADGTTATGLAPLPSLSPQEIERVRSVLARMSENDRNCALWMLQKGMIEPASLTEQPEDSPAQQDVGSVLGDTAGLPLEGDLMTFGTALELLKKGACVARLGWNGKGMWLALSCDGSRRVPAANFWAPANQAWAAQQPSGTAVVLPAITMKTADGSILMGWLASQSDMLAEDWVVVQ